MELHKLCCFLTQGRELPSFWSSTMEVHSFTNLKLQSAFPTVWLSFFEKAIFTPHFFSLLSIANVKNLLKTDFCLNFWHGWNLFFALRIIYIVYLGGLLHKSHSLVPRPHLRERGSGDIRPIPRASLTFITFWREISLRQSHCRKDNL